MVKETSIKDRPDALNIVGRESAGVTKRVATGLGMCIKEAFGTRGKHIKIKGMRFIPSTKIDLGEGSFQVMANTVVEVIGPDGEAVRPQAFDSILTVGRRPHAGQVIENIKLPKFDR